MIASQKKEQTWMSNTFYMNIQLKDRLQMEFTAS